ncbi:MAG: peptidylprolyl isomerase [Defluviitaleaceae bacterium]|nr:peptidylprolyl isomerase [Defluviitaleaceae bacterium]
MKKILLCGFMLLFLLAVPAACGNGDDASDPVEAHVNGNGDDATDSVEAHVNDNGDDANDPVVARINGNVILASDVRIHLAHAEETLFWEFVMATNSFEMDVDAPHDVHGTFGGAIIYEALQSAIFYFMFVDMAKEFGVEVDESQLAMLSEEIEMYIAEHGEEDFYELLDRDGFRDRDHFKEVVAVQFLLDDLIFTLLEDEEAFAPFAHLMPPEEEIPFLYGAMHILGHFDEFETEAEALEYVNALMERIQDGEDFVDLMFHYTQDGGLWDFPFGYTFAAGDMQPEFDALVRSLEIGEIGGPVSTVFGYHIVKRVEPIDTNDWFRLNMRQPQTLQDRQVEAIFVALQNRIDNANIERLPALDEIEIDTFMH